MYFLLTWRQRDDYTGGEGDSVEGSVEGSVDDDEYAWAEPDYQWDEMLENQLTDQFEAVGGVMEEGQQAQTHHYYI